MIKTESVSGQRLAFSLYMFSSPLVFRIMDREHISGARYYALNFSMRCCKASWDRSFFDIQELGGESPSDNWYQVYTLMFYLNEKCLVFY